MTIQLFSTQGVDYGIIRPVGDSTPRPMLINLAIDLTNTLGSTYNGVGELLIAAPNPWCVVALDGPCSGNFQIPPAATDSGMSGWKALVDANVDFISMFASRVQQVIADVRSRGFADQAIIAANGFSRGAFLALHLASLGIVSKITGICPLIRLTGLMEFQGAPLGEPLPLVPSQLVSRSVYLCDSNRDYRVSAFAMHDFCRAVVQAHGTANADISWKFDSVAANAGGHSTAANTAKDCAQWILKQWGEAPLA